MSDLKILVTVESEYKSIIDIRLNFFCHIKLLSLEYFRCDLLHIYVIPISAMIIYQWRYVLMLGSDTYANVIIGTNNFLWLMQTHKRRTNVCTSFWGKLLWYWLITPEFHLNNNAVNTTDNGLFSPGELLNWFTCMLHNEWINDFFLGKTVTRVTKEMN